MELRCAFEILGVLVHEQEMTAVVMVMGRGFQSCFPSSPLSLGPRRS